MKTLVSIVSLTAACFGAAVGGWRWAGANPPASRRHDVVEVPLTNESQGSLELPFLTWLKSAPSAELAAHLVAHPTATTSVAQLETQLLLLRWSELDPSACVAWLVAQQRPRELDSVLMAWARRDPHSAWAAMNQLSEKMCADCDCRENFCKFLAEADPESYLTLPPPSRSFYGYDLGWANAFEKIALKDPARGLLIARTTPFDMWRSLARTVGKQPALACAWAADASLVPEKARIEFQNGLIEAWSRNDPQAAADYLLTQPELMRDNASASDDVLRAMATKDVKLALHWLTEHYAGSAMVAQGASIGYDLGSDPHKWLPDFISAMPDEPTRLALLEKVLERAIRRTDLKDLQAIQEAPDTPEWRLIVAAVAHDYLWNHTVEETTQALATAQGQLQTALALGLATSGKVTDTALVIQILRDHAEVVDAEVITDIFRTSPTAGQQILSRVQDGAVWEAATRYWAEQDPAASQLWVESLADHGVEAWRQLAAVRGLVAGWCQTDEYAASEWVATLPVGGVRDAGAWELARNLATADPAAAWTWATSVPQPAEDRKTLPRIAKAWLAQDPVSARAAINTAPLEPALRAELLTP